MSRCFIFDIDGTIANIEHRLHLIKADKPDWDVEKHDLPRGALYMRKQGDHKHDHVLKLELLAQMRQDGYDPIMAFDDRKAVVDMWRAAGIPCAQVAEGNF